MKKPMPKWAKITIIVVCSLALVLGLFTALWHLSLYIMSFENDVHRDDMVIESVISIEEYNEQNGTDFKHFDNIQSTTTYSYNDKLVFIEEVSVVDGVEVSMLVTVLENTYGIDYIDIFDKSYQPSIRDAQKQQYSNVTVYIIDGKAYLQIQDDNCSYDFIINSTEDSVWKAIIDHFKAN